MVDGVLSQVGDFGDSYMSLKEMKLWLPHHIQIQKSYTVDYINGCIFIIVYIIISNKYTNKYNLR